MITFKKILGLGLLLAFLQVPLVQAQDDELLAPEEAFSLKAWIDGDKLIAEYNIAPGYYMYRQRFDFEIETSDASVRFDVAQIPAGKLKNDEFFGEIETYRDQVIIQLPILFDSVRATEMKVKATSQGCADIGVCYPPLKQTLNVKLASNTAITPTAWAANASASEPANDDIAALQSLLAEVNNNLDNQQAQSNSSASSGSDALGALLALGEDLGLDDESEILHPDQAFILSARLDANNTIQTDILLAPQIYLYRDKLKIALVSGDGHALGPISVPRGKMKDDEFFGPTEVIYDRVKVAIPLMSGANASNRIQLSYSYQGCVEDRICYPPVTKYLDVDAGAGLIQVVDQLDALDQNGGNQPKASMNSNPASISEQDQFTLFLQDKSLLVIIGLFFLAGIGLTITPVCYYF